MEAERFGEIVKAETQGQRQLLRMCLLQGWKCYWCLKLMTWGNRRQQPFEKDQATIDHLYDRFDVRRMQGDSRKVAACAECNCTRGKEAEARHSIAVRNMSYEKRKRLFCVEVVA